MQTPTSRANKSSGIKTLVLIPELNFVEMGRIELPSDVVLPGLLRGAVCYGISLPQPSRKHVVDPGTVA